MTTEPATSQGRSRRKPGEVRELLVGVAREVFIDVGYQGASLRQIAAKAGTTQAVLYRYFPSKAQLFQESVLRPFEDFVAQLTEDWRSTSVSARSTRDLIAGFTESLYDFSTTHRGLIVALLAADAHGKDSIGDSKTAFAQTISAVVGRALDDAVSRGWADIDVEVAAPATMAMIISTALLDDWLFPPASRPDRARILAEIVRYEVRAITGEDCR
jgi:AcrR family transcriptional regulator